MGMSYRKKCVKYLAVDDLFSDIKPWVDKTEEIGPILIASMEFNKKFTVELCGFDS